MQNVLSVRNLSGVEFSLQATHTWSGETNGNQVLSLTVEPSRVNDQFLADLGEMWTVIDDESTEYKVTRCKRKGSGDKLYVDVGAIPLFFDDFDMQRIYERYDQHMTANAYYSLIFNGSGYDFVLVDSFYALDWEGVGDGATRLDGFKRGLERYGAEFRIVGKTVYLESRIGRDTSFMYRHRLNASNITQEIDAGAMYTYARGYGDFAEGQDEDAETHAGLKREYTSPLAQVIGVRHAPPIKNGNITTTETMDTQLKRLVDESLTISVSADIHDLRRQGYELAQPQLGDRVFLIDERIGLNEEVRVVNIEITKDWRGNVLDLKLTFGSQRIGRRHQSSLSTAAQQITDLLAGRAKLPFNVLPAAKQVAVRKLEEAMTELIFGNGENGVQGIIAQDKNDPNKLMWMNSNGWMISTDGGVTANVAATADGLVTDALTAGSISTNNISIIGDSNYFYWDGTALMAIDPTDAARYVRLRSDGLYVAKGAVTVEREDGFQVIVGGKLNHSFDLQGDDPPRKDNQITFDFSNNYWKTVESAYYTCQRYSFSHVARYLIFEVFQYCDEGGQSILQAYDSSTGEAIPMAQITSTRTSSTGTATDMERMVIDLGTPNGGLKAVQLRLRTGVDNVAAYAKTVRRYQSDFLPS